LRFEVAVGVGSFCDTNFGCVLKFLRREPLVYSRSGANRVGSAFAVSRGMKEPSASQLAAIFATIILNMRLRLDEERRLGKKSRKL
jgi:hypothetical protein